MQKPWQLHLYRLGTRLAQPAAGLLLRTRLRKGKEDPARLGERRGIPGLGRPPGRLIWIHGASVGETLSLAPVIEQLAGRGIAVLVTSGTVTSARLMANRLPPGAFHQFIPLDAPAFMRRFLGAWRPDLGIIAESELWPNMIVEARRLGVPLMQVNGRMSERSFARWSRQRGLSRALLSSFDLVIAQTHADAERFIGLGAPRVYVSGNLKYDTPPPPVDPTALAILEGAIGGRPFWIAASTHPGEDEEIIAAHKSVAAAIPRLLTIIAPRHPERGADIAYIADEMGVAASRRGLGLNPDGTTDLYIADTLGELGLFYRIAPVVFVGGSLVRHGGQNPIEPAKLGAAILHGPFTHNFSDVYADLDKADGARLVKDQGELAQAVGALLRDPRQARQIGRRALTAVQAQAGAFSRVMQSIEPFIARAEMRERRARQTPPDGAA